LVDRLTITIMTPEYDGSHRRPGTFSISKVGKGGKKLHVNVLYRPATRDFAVGESVYANFAAVLAARPELTNPQSGSPFQVFQTSQPTQFSF
jgi:hypothetical protein